ncbi:hypothetical protein BDZ89DRAFT_1058633 [Hymenopellis radicata]|nr:hypothetical protein BDZ89DRAFT_1058633 [Hymenopellis radicata]
MPGNRLALFPEARDASFRLQIFITSFCHILLASPSLPRLHLPRVCESCWFRCLGIDWRCLRERATPRSGSRPRLESIPAGFRPTRVHVPRERHLILLRYSTHIFWILKPFS